MEVELWNENTKAIVDPRGAWLTNLSDENGDIFFPKRQLKNEAGKEKTRGGCHVCLPNFGPGGESGQPQHGFGRELEWGIIDRTDDSVLLELTRGPGVYEAMRSELSYQLAERALVMTLELTNRGATDLRVAPAFHPYFALAGSGDVKINGETQLLDELSETRFVSGKTQELQLPGRTFTMASEELPVWAVWTDQLGDYVCVEPSRGGFTFLEEVADEAEVLRPGQIETYVLRMLWE